MLLSGLVAFSPLGVIGFITVVVFFGATFSLTSSLSLGACYKSRRPRIRVIGDGVFVGRAPSMLTSSLLFTWALDAILTGPGGGELGGNSKILVLVFWAWPRK